MKKTGKIGVVAGIAAAATAAAGAYYLYYSKNAKKNRTVVKAWTIKAEREILSKAKKLTEDTFNESNYKAIVAAVTAKYKKLKKFKEVEGNEFMTALGSAWRHVKKDFSKVKIVGTKKNRS